MIDMVYINLMLQIDTSLFFDQSENIFRISLLATSQIKNTSIIIKTKIIGFDLIE